MRKIIAILLVLTLCLVSCKSNNPPDTAAKSTTATNKPITSSIETTTSVTNTGTVHSDDTVTTASETTLLYSDVSSNAEPEKMPEFYSMDDPAFLEYVEDSIRDELVTNLGNYKYSVENVQASYMPDEYYESLAFNSQENIYFGHTVSELNDLFQGKKYVFDLGSDGQTVVKEMETLEDNTYDEIIKNVAIGTGIILVCVTVSVITSGAGAPVAITTFFSYTAKSAAIAALRSVDVGKLSAVIVSGITTGNINISKKEALKMSEDFKLGAISGFTKGVTDQLL